MTTQMLSPVADHRRDEWPDDLLERLAAGDSVLWADVVRAFRPCLLARASEVGLKSWQRQDMEQRVWLALLRNATGGLYWWEAAIALVMLAGFGWLFLMLGVRLFRTGSISYSSRVKIGRALGWGGQQ